jgi:hypothetical protein
MPVDGSCPRHGVDAFAARLFESRFELFGLCFLLEQAQFEGYYLPFETYAFLLEARYLTFELRGTFFVVGVGCGCDRRRRRGLRLGKRGLGRSRARRRRCIPDAPRERDGGQEQ